jgi:hypothetical protein
VSGGSAQASMADEMAASKKHGGEQKQGTPVGDIHILFHGSVRKGCFLRDPPSLAEPTRSPRSTRLACPVRPFPIAQTTSLDSNKVAFCTILLRLLPSSRMVYCGTSPCAKTLKLSLHNTTPNQISKPSLHDAKTCGAGAQRGYARCKNDIGDPGARDWDRPQFHLGDFSFVWSTHPLSHEL